MNTNSRSSMEIVEVLMVVVDMDGSCRTINATESLCDTW